MENQKKYFGLETIQDWRLYRYKEANSMKRWAVETAKRLRDMP